MDLAIFETHDGGDLMLRGRDLAMYFGIENHPYLGMFGGNKAASTTNIVTDSQSFDWWGNNLVMPGDQSIQMNSLFEKALDEINLTSAGRVRLIAIIKRDLEFMSSYAKIEVEGIIPSDDRFDVTIKIMQNLSSVQIAVISYRKSADGDYFILDYNNDFNL